MPRVNDVMQVLPGSYGVPDTTIESSKYNAQLDDLIADANTPRPIVAGGTGAGTAIGAFDNFSTMASSISSASTVNLSAASGSSVTITGTAAITSFGTAKAGLTRRLIFSGAATLTYNATSMILPGSENIVTAAGDTAVALSLGSGNWRVVEYTRFADAPLTTPITPFARTILDDANAAAMRATLGLGNSAILDVGTTPGTVADGGAALQYQRALGSGENLNDIRDPGAYSQNTNAGAAGGTNYPVPTAGLLEVVDGVVQNVKTVQRYTVYATGRLHQRIGMTTGVWSPWVNVTPSAATTSDEGLMSAADKVKLNGIAAGAQVNLPVGTGSGTVAAGNDSRIVNAVPNTRTVAAGSGLTGGGALSANQTLTLGTPGTLTNSTTNAVTTNSHTHAISLTAADVGAVPTNRTVTAGTGLTGGGALSGNITLNVSFGTTSATACVGNDSRLANSREWTAATVSEAEAIAGTATTRRAWTAQRVRQNASAIAIGVDQTWVVVTGSRVNDTAYQNTTGRPIEVSIYAKHNSSSNGKFEVSSNGSTWVVVGGVPWTADAFANFSAIIPDGHYYRSNGLVSGYTWAELR